MKRKLLSLVLAFAMTASLFTVGASAAEPAYGDTAGHWAESSIDRWSGYGVVQGSDGDFLPDGELTCAQLATILARLLNLPAAPDAGFSDVAINAWYADAINRCAAAGILNGNGDGTVSPTATISRERAMVMLGRALGVEPVTNPDLSKYDDAAKVAPYAQGMVAALIDAGIVGGVTDTELAPTGSINRASTVTILDRAITTYVNTDGATVSATGGLTVVVANDVTVTGNTDRLLVPTSEVDVLLESSGSADAVTITGNDSTVTVKMTGIEKGEVIGDHSRIILDSAAATSVTLSGVKSSVETVGKSTIESVAVTESAAGATVTVGSGATVQTVTNLAADVLVTGDGDVKNVETATDMTVETPDTPVVNIGTDEITVIDREGEDNVLADKDSTKSDSDTVNVDKGSSSSPVHYHHFVYTSNWDVHDSDGNYSTYWLTHTGRCIWCDATVSGNCNHERADGACSLCGYKNSKEKPFLVASKTDLEKIKDYCNSDDTTTFFKMVDDVAILNIVTEEQANYEWANLSQQITITGNATLDLNGKTISVDNSNADSYGKATPVLFTVVGESAKLTIDDSSGENYGTIDCEAGWSQVYGISVMEEAKVVINGGSYYGAGTAVQVTTPGTVEINGGFFDLAETIKAYNKTPTRYDFTKYIINCIDDIYTAGLISMEGGTVVGFDPSNNPEGTGTTYVANGYKVVSEVQTNGDTWYTVVPNGE